MMKPSNRLNLAASLLVAVAAALFWVTSDRSDDGATPIDPRDPRDPELRVERPRPRAQPAVELPPPASLRGMDSGDWSELFRAAKVPGDIREEVLGLVAELDQITEGGAANEEQLAYVEAIQVLLADHAPGIARQPPDAPGTQ